MEACSCYLGTWTEQVPIHTLEKKPTRQSFSINTCTSWFCLSLYHWSYLVPLGTSVEKPQKWHLNYRSLWWKPRVGNLNKMSPPSFALMCICKAHTLIFHLSPQPLNKGVLYPIPLPFLTSSEALSLHALAAVFLLLPAHLPAVVLLIIFTRLNN